ncbi:hypothetical protein, partial [Mobilibacterium timonense]|uniref:hypothetical protein n=1 Tax=Mobilibacterium timonense TaxID=1871012 RepID=UPI002355A141
EIQSIIGLDDRQFSGIAMIPQGEFRKLLYASTDERIKIFRQLFHTELFSDFQRELKNREMKLRRENEDLHTRIRQIGDGADKRVIGIPAEPGCEGGKDGGTADAAADVGPDETEAAEAETYEADTAEAVEAIEFHRGAKMAYSITLTWRSPQTWPPAPAPAMRYPDPAG